jgi:hypothetical protein
MGMADVLRELSEFIRRGLVNTEDKPRPLLEALFGGRYYGKHLEGASMIRDVLALGGSAEGVPFAGLLNPDSAPSGPYGGASLIWFPTPESRRPRSSIRHRGRGEGLPVAPLVRGESQEARRVPEGNYDSADLG